MTIITSNKRRFFMRTKLFAFGLLIIFAVVLLAFAQDKQPEYVGVDKCKTCHKAEKNGQQYKIWSENNHAKAFEALKSEKAGPIAEKAGIKGDPTKDEYCLSCHTTAGTKKNVDKSYDISEGVGCEACHGPGSLYRKMNIMKDYDASVAAGMIGTREKGAIEKMCANCHGEVAKGHDAKEAKFDLEAGLKQIAHPVPAENDRRKK
jgi:hypothetical protein